MVLLRSTQMQWEQHEGCPQDLDDPDYVNFGLHAVGTYIRIVGYATSPMETWLQLLPEVSLSKVLESKLAEVQELLIPARQTDLHHKLAHDEYHDEYGKLESALLTRESIECILCAVRHLLSLKTETRFQRFRLVAAIDTLSEKCTMIDTQFAACSWTRLDPVNLLGMRGDIYKDGCKERPNFLWFV